MASLIHFLDLEISVWQKLIFLSLKLTQQKYARIKKMEMSLKVIKTIL